MKVTKKATNSSSAATAAHTMTLEVRDLYVNFIQDMRADSPLVQAVRGISFHVAPGEIVGLVGESGSGKSVSAAAVMRLLPAAAHIRGAVMLAGETISKHTPTQMAALRGRRISMIFQEPTNALNPLHTLYKQVREAVAVHAPDLSEHEIQERVRSLLQAVEFDEGNGRWEAYPHELSGGQQQRVMIAMALAHNPELLIADEPTTALDVTTQFQILHLLKRLQRERGMAMLLITHNLDIVRACADRVYVMEHGVIVEEGPTAALFKAPRHPYTRKLLEARHLPKWGQQPNNLTVEPILVADTISVSFQRKGWFRSKSVKHAVDGVSCALHPGETLGIVGESGSGKTTFAMAALGLQEHQGRVSFAGEDLVNMTPQAKRALRAKLQVVFQDPYGSLNPRFTIEDAVGEGLLVHAPTLSRVERQKMVAAALDAVGLSAASILHRYPHEFSGGQRQRIALARAIVLKPKVLVLDEPTSALDASTQRDVLELLRHLQVDMGLAYLLISHDFHVIQAACHRVMVLRHGQVVESGSVEAIFEKPRNPYTQSLIRAAMLNFQDL